ncbi:hypothetical protein Q5752_004373 [Cryptotrichosporon argae]
MATWIAANPVRAITKDIKDGIGLVAVEYDRTEAERKDERITAFVLDVSNLDGSGEASDRLRFTKGGWTCWSSTHKAPEFAPRGLRLLRSKIVPKPGGTFDVETEVLRSVSVRNYCNKKGLPAAAGLESARKRTAGSETAKAVTVTSRWVKGQNTTVTAAVTDWPANKWAYWHSNDTSEDALRH